MHSSAITIAQCRFQVNFLVLTSHVTLLLRLRSANVDPTFFYFLLFTLPVSLLLLLPSANVDVTFF